jgi:D-alanyl-D-alanine carboxypeptidase
MFRLVSRSSRGLRYGAVALATVVCATAFTVDTADAKRKRSRHSVARVTYAPPFASVIVDANTGATLQATNADAIRHPASLTKIMTLYLLFERLESGKLKLDSEMDVSEHAAEQAPTKLGLRPGSSLNVEDAIKGLVTRSANDASVVIAEAIAGDEEEFAKLMTRKARALGMSKTVYRNANGLPDMEQVTTARDQAILGRAIQDRFPRYYRYFATESFRFRGKMIRGHNRLLGKVEGVDGIKTGYTRASGFNLVTSLKRDNRYLVGVVLGGRSGGSRDATMRNLLAENLPQGATRRTVAMITDRGGNEPAMPAIRTAAATPAAPVAAVEAEEPLDAEARGQQVSVSRLTQRVTSTVPALATADPAPAPVTARPQAKAPPAPLSSGVISSQALAAIPGAEEPMKPVRVQTVQVKAGSTTKTAAAAPMRIIPTAPAETAPEARQRANAPIITSALPPPVETSQADRTTVVQKSGAVTPVSVGDQMRVPARNPSHGTGQGILGVLPAHASTMASADPEQAIPPASAPIGRTVIESPRMQARAEPIRTEPAVQHVSTKPVIRTGWIVQVGALESEREARARLDTAREKAGSVLGKADSFTETVAKGDKQLYRARFAGLDKDKAEAACKTLKRSDISCIAIKN